jgi:hypothetical protein
MKLTNRIVKKRKTSKDNEENDIVCNTIHCAFLRKSERLLHVKKKMSVIIFPNPPLFLFITFK